MKIKKHIFISFSYTKNNMKIKDDIEQMLEENNSIVNISENKDKSGLSDNQIWNYLLNRIKGSTITIVLLTNDLLNKNKNKISYKKHDFVNSGWVYNEISASLRNENNNNLNGLLVITEEEKSIDEIDLPEILEANFEFIIFCTLDEFYDDPFMYINKANQKRLHYIKNQYLLQELVPNLHEK